MFPNQEEGVHVKVSHPEEQRKRDNQQRKSKVRGRVGVIQSIRTPLHFFTLAVIAIEGILGILTSLSSGIDRTALIVGMVIALFALIFIVAFMSVFRPTSLYRPGAEIYPGGMDAYEVLRSLTSRLPGMNYRCRNNKNWTMLYVSDGCFELTGYHAKELLLDNVVSYAELIHPDDQTPVWNAVQAAVRAKKFFVLVYRIRTKSGQLKFVWEQGRSIGRHELKGFITDITPSARGNVSAL